MQIRRTPLYRSPVILYLLRLNRRPHRTRVQDSDHFQRKRISSEAKAKEAPVGERSQEILESGSRKYPIIFHINSGLDLHDKDLEDIYGLLCYHSNKTSSA